MAKGVYKRPDISGKRVGDLTVVRQLNKRQHNHRVFLCKCECGKEVEVNYNNLNSKNTKSCGCRRITQNGLYKHPLYEKWHSMKRRCYSKSDRRYKYYGARGIKVCKRWHHFPAFVADMGVPPKPGLSLDRIDVNGDYSPTNCRWATNEQQQGNRRNSIIVEINGQKKCLTAWARHFGIPQPTLNWRYKRGWRYPELFSTT